MKKPIVLGIAVVASLALVGGTVAAGLSVKDNANPFGVQISPSALEIDESKKVTLEWGKVGIADIGGLKGGDVKGDYEIGLKASKNENIVETAYEGVFNVKLTDKTDGHGELYSGEALMNYIHVKVYDKASSVGDREAIITVDADHKDVSQTVSVDYGVEKLVYITVSMDRVSSEVYDAIKNDVLYLQVDWNKASTDAEDTGSTPVYFKFAEGAVDQRVHYWKDGGAASDWPGVAMTQYKDNVYTCTIPAVSDGVVFTWKASSTAEEVSKTGDIDFSGYAAATPYWNGSAWAALSSADDEIFDYYLVGKFAGRAEFIHDLDQSADYGLEETEEAGQYKLAAMTFAAGDEFKIVNAAKDAWYGVGEANVVITEAMAGNYDIYFRADDAKVSDPVWEPYGGHIYLHKLA
ncbi:MAG: starch-binding protein [Bacilli bacterium]|nr:starch-binding protein [Bacilli bacterium]